MYPGDSGWRSGRLLGKTFLFAIGTMEARGVAGTFFTLLLCCWPEVRLWPVRMASDPKAELAPPFKILDDDMATVFDEILVQEMLEPNRSSMLEMQRPPAMTVPKSTQEEATVFKEKNHLDIPKKQQEKQLSLGSPSTISFDDEEKETLYQIKSLAALEKIISSLRRAIGSSLQKRKRLQQSMLRAYYRHRRGMP
ncbi:sperm acrosome-associated protein 7-like isoform X2 [Ochotona princeps]|uniref:sperm acrosome-associated protein 7-like isoform X2 n=1 Tax=Ochotona princeps TaxID=9978 RepID=UPI00271552F2|nr:sperm acrosome-associated protein 7-like isoform X2 [Ochotona princeps]